MCIDENCAFNKYNSVYILQMETDEQLSGEKTVKDKSEDDKSQEEEVESAPVIKHLEENRLFSEYYLVLVYRVRYHFYI